MIIFQVFFFNIYILFEENILGKSVVSGIFYLGEKHIFIKNSSVQFLCEILLIGV